MMLLQFSLQVRQSLNEEEKGDGYGIERLRALLESATNTHKTAPTILSSNTQYPIQFTQARRQSH